MDRMLRGRFWRESGLAEEASQSVDQRPLYGLILKPVEPGMDGEALAEGEHLGGEGGGVAVGGDPAALGPPPGGGGTPRGSVRSSAMKSS